MRRWFGWPSVVAAVTAVAVAGAILVQLGSERAWEIEKRAYLQGEIAKVDLQIAELKEFRPMVMAVLARKHVIETLQRDRGQGVRLLGELARLRPQGVRLVSISLAGGRGRVEGVAESQQALRSFAFALAASSVLQEPQELESRGREFSFRIAFRPAAQQ
jgi:type IV pilus assembly protein PilN